MKLSSEKVDVKKTYLAVTTMLMAILCIDLYMVVIKFLGNEYSLPRNFITTMYKSMQSIAMSIVVTAR